MQETTQEAQERKIYKSDLDITIEDAVAQKKWLLYVQPPGSACPNCELLEKFFTLNNIEHQAVNIKTPESATEIAFRGIMPRVTPVLQHGTAIFYTELWQEKGYKTKKTLDIEAIKRTIDPDKKDWVDVKAHECKDGVCTI